MAGPEAGETRGAVDARAVRRAGAGDPRPLAHRGVPTRHRVRAGARAAGPPQRARGAGGRASDDGGPPHAVHRRGGRDRGGPVSEEPRTASTATTATTARSGDGVAPLVAVYADESCLGNGKQGDNPGGAGVLVEYRTRGGELVRRDLWVAEPATTNNRMALRSAIEAFLALSRKGGRF